MRVLGIDPGGAGALALLNVPKPGVLHVEIADMPVLTVSRGRGTKREVDVRQLSDILSAWSFDVCYFERVQGMEGDGVSSAFNFGRMAGAAEAVVKLRGARFQFVTPPVWKKAIGLLGKAKDDSRARAMDLFPAAAGSFKRKMDDGRADAALIAEYGRRKEVELGLFM